MIKCIFVALLFCVFGLLKCSLLKKFIKNSQFYNDFYKNNLNSPS